MLNVVIIHKTRPPAVTRQLKREEARRRREESRIIEKDNDSPPITLEDIKSAILGSCLDDESPEERAERLKFENLGKDNPVHKEMLDSIVAAMLSYPEDREGFGPVEETSGFDALKMSRLRSNEQIFSAFDEWSS